MHECNNCDRRCKIDLKKISREEMLKDCPYHLKPTNFKIPILLNLMTNIRKLKPTTELLEMSNLIIEERENYPYFILEDEKKR